MDKGVSDQNEISLIARLAGLDGYVSKPSDRLTLMEPTQHRLPTTALIGP